MDVSPKSIQTKMASEDAFSSPSHNKSTSYSVFKKTQEQLYNRIR